MLKLKVGDKAIVKEIILHPEDYDSPLTRNLTTDAIWKRQYWLSRAVVVLSLEANNSQAVNMGYACVVKEQDGDKTGIFFWDELELIRS